MNLKLHIKWDACNFLQCTFFQKHYNYIFVYGYIVISRYILNFKYSSKYTQFFTFILFDPRANVRNICKIFEVVPIEVHLLSEVISNKISTILEVTFVPDKEIWVYEHKIEYLAKKCFTPKHTPSRCVFLERSIFPD